MTPDEARVGTRVTWAEPHPRDVGEPGTVLLPTLADWDEHRTAGYPVAHSVLVHWDRDPLDAADWMNPAWLVPLPDEAQP